MKSSWFKSNIIRSFMTLMAFIVLMMPAGQLNAAPQGSGIEVKSEIGFQDYTKREVWFPVKLTLTNRMNEDISGEVVVATVSNQYGTTNEFVVPVELPQNSDVTLTIGIPGDVLTKTTSKIMIYQGSYANGKLLPIIGNDYIVNKITSSYTIGVLSRDPDTLNFMPALNQRGYDLTVIPLSDSQLPDESLLYDTLDSIVINDYATSALTDKQVRAITEWVKRGGTLVLSGGAGYAKSAAAFQEIAPFQATGTAELTDLTDMAFAGEAEWPAGSKLTVSTGQLQESSAILMQGDFVLAASRTVGLGEVVYAAFDPSLAPAASWPGSAVLWSKLMLGDEQLFPGTINNYNGSIFQNLNYIIDEFPSINPPKLMVLMLIFGIYLLIAAPVLYIVLKKVDRREWAWWLIPALSVVAGAAVFLFGAEDKRAMSYHTIEIAKLTGGGESIISGATAVFVPNGGTVRMDLGEKLFASSYNNGSSFNNGELNANGKSQIVIKDDRSLAVWRDVPYWSTRKAWIDEHIEPNTGQFDIRMKWTGTGYEVTVVNQTEADLSDAALLMYGQAYRLGDLKIGEQGSASVQINSNMSYGYQDYGYSLFNYSGNNRNDDKYRERDLLNAYMNRNYGNNMNDSQPVIVGFSKDKRSSYKVNDTSIKGDHLKMYVQKLDKLMIDGSHVSVSTAALAPSVTVNTLQHMNLEWGNMLYVGQGELVMQYTLPRSSEINYKELVVLNNSINSQGSWQLWHEASGAWVMLPSGAEDAQQYLVGGQTLILRLNAASEMNVSIPIMLLEGEVQ